METEEFAVQLRGGRLTTAEVLYFLPDHPKLLQSFIWQTLDVAPEYPRVHRFLDYWRREIQAIIHSVRLSTVGLVSPAKLRFADTVETIH
jgi:uncharacterized protein Usg